MGQATEQVALLQQLVDEVPELARTVHAACGGELPAEAQAVCVGALNYLLDLLDIFPDHYAGLGLADDAAVLCVAAKLAVGHGAKDAALERMAGHARGLAGFFGELSDPFERFVAALPAREVRGRTAAQILGSKDLRAGFDGDVGRAIKGLKPAKIELPPGGDEMALKELLKMTRAALKKAGLVS